jgi:hypothetical protein
MTHCPQCDQKYNTNWVTQVEYNVAECFPKLEWQTLILKNTTKLKQTIK